MVLTGLLMLRSLTRGFIQSPVLTVTMATLPDHQVRLGTSVRGLLNSFGATFGIAVAGLVLQQRLEARTFSLRARPQMASAEAPAQLSGQTDVPFERWLIQEASLLAYHDMFAITAALVLVTAIPVLGLRHRRLAGSRKVR